MSINILNNFKKKRGKNTDMPVKSPTNSNKAKFPEQGQNISNSIHELYCYLFIFIYLYIKIIIIAIY